MKNRHGRNPHQIEAYEGKSGNSANCFLGTVGVTRTAPNGSTGHGQGRDMGQCIQISSAAAVANPKALLAGSFKTGIVALTFGTQSVSPLETVGIPVNGKTMVLYLVQPLFFLPLFQFLWLQGQQPVLD